MLVRSFQALVFALICSSALADDWPQWLGPKRDSVWRETGIVEKFPAEGPRVLWRTPIHAGYSGPSTAEGRVYVTERENAQGTSNPTDAFARGTIAGKERIVCLDERTGKEIWKREYDCAYTMSYPAGPRVTPLVHEGKVYSLGAEGNLFCLGARDGKVIWSKDFKKDFGAKTPLWGFAGHPLLDGNRLVCLVGAEDGVVIALDKDSGKESWRALKAKEPGYSSPIIYEAGGKRQLIVWHPESVNALEPETGKVLWSVPFSAKMGLAVATPRILGGDLFLTSFYSGSLMLKLEKEKPEARELWRTQKASEKDTTHLNAILSTPFLENGYIYGVCSYGQLRCLKMATGERVWETFKATTGGEPIRWANAFIVKNGNRFFLANEKGDLIIARMTPAGYEEISRAHLLEPTNTAAGRDVVWSHPAFANRRVYARNDKEIVCVDLAK